MSPRDPRQFPFRPDPEIAPRPGQTEAALAEVLRRRRRKAAVAAVVVTLGIATGGVALAVIPRGSSGQDTLQVATPPGGGAPTASVSSPLTRTTTKPGATSPAPSTSRAAGGTSAPVGPPPTSLSPAPSVDGLVSDPAGNPLAGIAVYAATVTPSQRLAVSDPAGRFSVPCAAVGDAPLLLVDVDAGQWAWQLVGGGASLAVATAPACGARSTTVLDAASVVTGQYDRDGAPGAGSVVTVTCVDAPALPLAATVAADGSYRLGGLSSGTCTLLHTTDTVTCTSVDDPTLELQAGEPQVIDLHDTGCSSATPSDTPTPPSPTPTPTPGSTPGSAPTPAPTPTPTQ